VLKTKASDCNFKISPYPDGKDFAFSIIDDTDYCQHDNIVPVYEQLHALGFRTTKTVWVFDQKYNNSFRKDKEKPVLVQEWGLSLQNESYQNYIKELESKGFEIALHGVSAGNDYRDDIIRGYDRFKEIFGYYPKIDILHAQNIENLYCGRHKFDFWLLKILEKLTHNSDYQGHIFGSQYFWGDIAKEHVDYIRLPFHEIKELNLLKINPTFPFHDPRRPFVKYWFINSDGANFDKFMELTNNKNMEKLEIEKGTTIIYTHFANGFCHRNGGKYSLKKPFKDRMSGIRARNGWFATASQILDRFVMIRNLKLIVDSNSLCVINTGQHKVENVTVVSNTHHDFIDASGKIFETDKNGNIIIPIINPYSAILLRDLTQGNDDSFRENCNISKKEHIRIELFNYLRRFLFF
jgi:hypothetical protein